MALDFINLWFYNPTSNGEHRLQTIQDLLQMFNVLHMCNKQVHTGPGPLVSGR